ncbi:MAG TPA: TolC family protein, partial [Bacteroidota bacterium]|nr:TolC family protein [Bacteroidota bacterium]
MRKFVAIASKQYEVGKGSQADVLRGQTELSSLLAGMVTLRQELGVARSMMNTLLYRPVDAPLGDVPEIERAMPAWTFEQLRPLALENRPDLKGMQYSLAMNTADLSAAKREYWPDLMVQVMYKDMAMTRNDFWSTMIGVSIPIAPWASGKVTSKADEEELNVKNAEEDLAAMSSMVLFDVQDALAKVRSNEEIVTLDKTTVIPQAEQTMISTQAAYATGKTDFLALLDAYKTLLSTRLDYYTAVTAFMKSQSWLEQAVGLSIPEIAQRIAQ